MYLELALPLLLYWWCTFKDACLGVLKGLQGAGFWVALFDNFEHGYHALTVSGKQLQIVKHIVTLSYRKESQLVNILLVAVISHFPVVLTEPESLEQSL